MPSITKDSNREKIQQIAKANIKTIKSIEAPSKERKWEDEINHTKSYSYVHTLASRLRTRPDWYEKYVSYREPTLITALEWNTPLNMMGIHNLPKLGDFDAKRLNFAFGQNTSISRKNFKTMVSTPKTAICVFAHKIKIDDKDYNKLQIYCLAPELKYSELPIIYRLDILSIPDTNKFFGVRAVTLVGGCIDGLCPLFQINTDSVDGARLYKHKSSYTKFSVNPHDDVSNLYYDVKTLDGVSTLEEACDYAFSIFNVKSKILDKSDMNFMDMINEIEKGTAVSEIPSGSEFVKAFLSKELSYIVGKERQMIYDDEGKIKQSNTKHRVNSVYHPETTETKVL